MDKRIAGAVIIVVAVCTVVAVYFVQYAPPAKTYKISGHVKTDGVALAGTTVTLDGESAVTDVNGYYEFTGLEGNKSYSLSVTKSGYESHSETVQLGVEDKQVSEITLKAVGIEMPLMEITNALASREGVSTENVELYFCLQAAENDNFAVGAMISEQKSIVLIFDESTSGITAEREFTATTSDERQAMSTLVLKKPLSRFTGSKIVPFDFIKTDDAYTFNYYDGYDMYLRRWGHGSATLHENGEVTLDSHVWG